MDKVEFGKSLIPSVEVNGGIERRKRDGYRWLQWLFEAGGVAGSDQNPQRYRYMKAVCGPNSLSSPFLIPSSSALQLRNPVHCHRRS